MSDRNIRIFPLGDSALSVEFGKTISRALNKKAIALSDFFERNPFPGFVESVPAYSSTTVFYDLLAVRRNFPAMPSAYEAVRNLAADAINKLDVTQTKSTQIVEIPFHVDTESALDLEFVAESSGLSPEKIIEIFTGTIYRVFMLGFLPGFSYMGEVDDRIATRRKDTPRVRIPKGSVGIAGKQTGIYSLESPGGWQIIGRADCEMFIPDAETPSLLKPGDQVQFIAIK